MFEGAGAKNIRRVPAWRKDTVRTTLEGTFVAFHTDFAKKLVSAIT